MSAFGQYAFGFSRPPLIRAAFSDCSELTSLSIPKNVKSIAEGVFEGCDALENVYCEAEEQPTGWTEFWARKEKGSAPVVDWGCKLG